MNSDGLEYKSDESLLNFRVEAIHGNEPAVNAWRVIYLRVALIVFVGIVFFSLINLQIVNGAYFKQQADNNRIYVEPIIAPRGIIYDRNGVPLVYNQDTVNAIIDTNIFQKKESSTVFPKLSNILGISLNEIYSLYNNGIKNNQSFIQIKDNISKDQMIEISADPTLQGIRIQQTTIRSYPYGSAISHVLGYVGLVNSDDLTNNPGLNDQDDIGKDGIEYEYDRQLRGVDGENIVEVDTLGHIVSTIKKQDPVPGDNIYLSIDINVQKQLDSYLAGGITRSSATGGAAIIENVNDGSILAMASLPSYDDNEFSQGISAQDYSKLVNDPSSPLLNRAISEAQPPGSVMKTITAPAGLQEGAITKDTIFYSGGTFEYGGTTFQDFEKIVRGNLNVVGGLQWSSNIFFYNTILKLGIDKFINYQKLFGVGALTGIDLPGEVTGQISSPQVKQELTGQIWYGGDSLNAAIGQGYTLVTPVQIANWISSIANGGTLFTPRVVSKIQDPEDQSEDVFGAKVQRQGFVKSQYLDVVKEGMHQAVLDGIDSNLKTSVVDVAGKTGTAEFGPKDANGNSLHEHAWVSGFAPFNKPQISFLVFLEGGGLSSNAEYVEKNFLNWYYGTYLK